MSGYGGGGDGYADFGGQGDWAGHGGKGGVSETILFQQQYSWIIVF